jgi:hypothetical protein
MSMLERVAQTLFHEAILKYRDDLDGPRATNWGSLTSDEREEYRIAAKRLVGQLREPSMEMVQAGERHMRSPRWNDAGEIFAAMINAVIDDDG